VHVHIDGTPDGPYSDACHSVLRIGRDGRARGHWSREVRDNKKLLSLYYGVSLIFRSIGASSWLPHNLSNVLHLAEDLPHHFFLRIQCGVFFLRGRY
jgi:hypothetical protein